MGLLQRWIRSGKKPAKTARRVGDGPPRSLPGPSEKDPPAGPADAPAEPSQNRSTRTRSLSARLAELMRKDPDKLRRLFVSWVRDDEKGD